MTSQTTDPVVDGGTASASPGEDRLEAAARTLPRRRFFSDMPDKGLFALVALAGFGTILILKTRTSVSTEVVAALAVGAMIFYGMVAFRLPAVQMRPDRLGDNFYYLGFIYTLASLSAALIQLRAAPNIEELLGNFGIALVTTVFGVAGRVLFVQMRGELDEVEDRVRRDLVAASLDLRSQLTLALHEFQTFHVGVLQASQETIAKTAAQAADYAKEIASLAETVARDAKASLDLASQQARELADMLKRIQEAVGQLPMLGKVELPSERLEKQITGFTAEIEGLVVELRQILAAYETRRRRWYWPFRG